MKLRIILMGLLLILTGVGSTLFILSDVVPVAEASNGHVCCIVGVCCPPPGENSAGDAQVYELAKLVQAQLGSFSSTGEPSERAIAVAQAILADFDLVPNGVGDAIVKGYAESFSHKKK